MSRSLMYSKGFDAYYDGESITENPYDETSQAFEYWIEGWEDAQVEYYAKEDGI